MRKRLGNRLGGLTLPYKSGLWKPLWKFPYMVKTYYIVYPTLYENLNLILYYLKSTLRNHLKSHFPIKKENP